MKIEVAVPGVSGDWNVILIVEAEKPAVCEVYGPDGGSIPLTVVLDEIWKLRAENDELRRKQQEVVRINGHLDVRNKALSRRLGNMRKVFKQWSAWLGGRVWQHLAENDALATELATCWYIREFGWNKDEKKYGYCVDGLWTGENDLKSAIRRAVELKQQNQPS